MLNITLKNFAANCISAGGKPEDVRDLLDKNIPGSREYLQLLSSMSDNSIETSAGKVYRIPLLPPTVCDELATAAKEYSFKTNLSEGADYRVEECILEEEDAKMFDMVTNELANVIDLYALTAYGLTIKGVSSIQLAKYTPQETAGSGWHHDTTSDISFVVSLNPGEFEGGGTGIRVYPHVDNTLDPLPKGHGIMFPGKLVQHRGLPVTKGERLLLVLWLTV